MKNSITISVKHKAAIVKLIPSAHHVSIGKWRQTETEYIQGYFHNIFICVHLIQYQSFIFKVTLIISMDMSQSP